MWKVSSVNEDAPLGPISLAQEKWGKECVQGLPPLKTPPSSTVAYPFF